VSADRPTLAGEDTMAATSTGRRKEGCCDRTVPLWSNAGGSCRLVAMLAWRLEALGLEVVAIMVAGLVARSIVSAVRTLKRARRY
jgi:hypothetical protein